MRKKVLIAGLMVATMLAVSACSSKNTTENPTTTADVTTTAAVTTTEATTAAEETDTEESTVTAGDMESETAGELTSDQIKSFAEEIQAAVAGEDLGWLADLSHYPIYVSLETGEGSEVQSKEDFMKLGEEKLFTEKLKEQIAAINPEELEVFGAGVIMGEDTNITFNNVDGEPAITAINL